VGDGRVDEKFATEGILVMFMEHVPVNEPKKFEPSRWCGFHRVEGTGEPMDIAIKVKSRKDASIVRLINNKINK
jgi:hypothetical protein